MLWRILRFCHVNNHFSLGTLSPATVRTFEGRCGATSRLRTQNIKRRLTGPIIHVPHYRRRTCKGHCGVRDEPAMNDWFPIRDKARPTFPRHRRNRIKHRPSCYERVVPRVTKINRVICFPRSRISTVAAGSSLTRVAPPKGCKTWVSQSARRRTSRRIRESLEVEEWQRVNFSARRLMFGWLALTLWLSSLCISRVSIVDSL